jgi:hypothetical protein
VDSTCAAVCSKIWLGRKINAGHFQAIVLSLCGAILSLLNRRSFDYDYDRILALLYFSGSRIAWVLSGLIYKRALLLKSAHSRYRAFKLSPFRSIKLFDFENDKGDDYVGTLKRPIVSSKSALFKKAEYIIHLRKLVADEIARLD